MDLLLKNVQQEHIKLIAELAKTLHIDIEDKSAKVEYDPEFVKKIMKGDDDKKKGKGIKVNIEDLWK